MKIQIIIYIASVWAVAGVVVTALFVLLAKEGFEDAEGFHEAPGVENHRAKTFRVGGHR